MSVRYPLALNPIFWTYNSAGFYYLTRSMRCTLDVPIAVGHTVTRGCAACLFACGPGRLQNSAS